jgi:PKD repeat protein
VTHQVSVVKPNVPPTASFSTHCDYLACSFDATASSDVDGTITDYAWDFGDGQTGAGSAADHVFDKPGTYDITLTVTDDQAATGGRTTTQVVVGAPAPSTVSYVGGAVNQSNTATPNVTTPPTVSAGDRLIMALSLNATNRVLSDPTGVTGWTVLGTTTTGGMQTRVYSKIATAADAGKKVTVTLDLAAKYTMTVADYAGVRTGTLVTADFAETVTRADHPSPTVDAPAGAWVVSYWADKSSATTGFALPASVTGRQALCSTGTGHVCSTLADSGGPVPTGQYDGPVATADSSSANATSWSIILRTIEPNQAPTAAFSFTCDGTVCDFDGTGSSDPDGSVVSWAWDFGDGATATGATPNHDFGATGTHDVTLTVTDDENTTGSLVVPVSVTRKNAAPTASFTTSCTFLACTFDASASGDTDGTVASYDWDFGDGATQTTTDPAASHSYDPGGAYTVTLTVTDNDGGTGTASRSVSPVAVRPIALVGSSVNQGNTTTPNVVVPAGTQAGDRLVLLLSVNNTTSTVGVGGTSGVTGLDQLDSATGGTMRTFVYSKTAAASDAGKTVRFALDVGAKYTLTAVVYSGDMLAPQLAKASETAAQAGHSTPTIDAAAGDWALSYWADKSSATTGFTLPGEVTARQATCGTSTGHVCSALADSGGPVPAGTYGGLTATADAASGNATMWTLLLRQAG